MHNKTKCWKLYKPQKLHRFLLLCVSCWIFHFILVEKERKKKKKRRRNMIKRLTFCMIFAMNFTFILNGNLLSVWITLKNSENRPNRKRKRDKNECMSFKWHETETLSDTFFRQPMDFMTQTKFHTYFIGSQYVMRSFGFVAENLSPSFKHFHYFAWWHLNARTIKQKICVFFHCISSSKYFFFPFIALLPKHTLQQFNLNQRVNDY